RVLDEFPRCRATGADAGVHLRAAAAFKAQHDRGAMKRWLLLLFLLLCGHAMAEGEDGMQTYQAITQPSQWLNTSRALKAEDLRGRIILLDFWTFCCINCMHVIPDLHALENEFGDKLTVIGVHSAKFANERDTSNIRSAILRYDIEHAVVNDSQFQVWQ